MTARAMTSHGEPPDGTMQAAITGLLTAVGAIVAGAIGAFGLWVANRTLGKAAFQTAINSGFSQLLDEVQKERAQLKTALEAERLANASERAQLRGDIINLTQVIIGLKRLLREHGIDVPEDWKPAPADAAEAMMFLTNGDSADVHEKDNA